MKFTNEHGLPSPLVRALSWKKQRYCDFSVTELLKPPRILQLERRHEERIEQDVSENIWSWQGTAMHMVLENLAAKENALSEEKLFLEIDGVKIGGAPDWYYRDGGGKWVLADLKTVSVWSLIFEPKGKDDWHKQTNIYAEMLRQHGFPVDKIEIWAVARDWKRNEMQGNPDYPKCAIKVVDIPVRPPEKVMDFIQRRIKIHLLAKDHGDMDLPQCTPEETWFKPGKFAVMKTGRKSAIRLFDNKEDAVARATEENGYVEERLGVATRCESFCSAAPFCSQYREYSNAREKAMAS